MTANVVKILDRVIFVDYWMVFYDVVGLDNVPMIEILLQAQSKRVG